MKKILIAFFTLIHIHSYGYQLIQDQATTPILNPYYKEMKTKKIRLNNGLEAYLISNPQAKQSGAVLSVHVGSWADPKETPGMAHFLEHMLFLGTKTYPDEAEFSSFIAQNGGLTNAFTANSQTSYLFSVDTSAFQESLDRFSRFFYEPTFDPSGIDRELRAIDQEFAKDRDNDPTRIYYIHKTLSRKQHPHSHFHVGNETTLKNVTREEMLKWYDANYSPDMMRLVVLSPLPLNDLTNLVESTFENIPEKKGEVLSVNEQIIPNNILGNYLYVSPVKANNFLDITWELPKDLSNPKGAKAAEFLCHLLGHEGEKSLLAQLKREQLADKLSCGSFQLGNNAHLLSINIELTDQGARDTKRVIDRLFQAIYQLKHTPASEEQFSNFQKLVKLNYQYPVPKPEFQFLMRYAMLVFQEDISTFPEKSLLQGNFDPGLIQRVANSLKPDRALFALVLPEKLIPESLDHVEPWLNIPYAIKPIPTKELISWSESGVHPSIDWPLINRFLPEDYAVIHQQNKEPKQEIPIPNLIVNTDRLSLYFAPDKIYGTPKASYHFEIKAPKITSESADNVVLTDLFIKGVKESLNALSYPATLAGYTFDITRNSFSIEVTVDGFSEKADTLLEEIFRHLTKFKTNEDSYRLHKSSLQRQYHVAQQESSLSQAIDTLKKVIYKEYITDKEKKSALRRVSFVKFQNFVDSIFDKFYVKSVIYGNMTEGEAKKTALAVLENFEGLPFPLSEQKNPEVVILPESNGPYYYESTTETVGNSTILAIENQEFSYKQKAIQKLLMQAIKQPFFDTLRTKQQTAYIVFSQAQEIRKQLFEFFAIQSNTHNPKDLLSRFETFIEGYLQEIGKTTFTEEEFETLKKSMIHLLEHPPESQKEMGALLANLYFEYDSEFDRISKLITAMKNLEYEDALKEIPRMIGKENRRRIAILVNGRVEESNDFNYSRIRNLTTFKNSCCYEIATETNVFLGGK